MVPILIGLITVVSWNVGVFSKLGFRFIERCHLFLGPDETVVVIATRIPDLSTDGALGTDAIIQVLPTNRAGVVVISWKITDAAARG